MIPERKTFYIAGPMTGIPQFNFPAFDVAAASLRSYGYLVVSPVELDDPSARSAALANETGDPEQYTADTGETWGDLLARDVKLIADEVSGVVALEGWEDSKGARLEVFVARTCGKPVYSYEEWLNDRTPGAPLTSAHKVPDWEINDVMHETVFGGDKFEAPEPQLVAHKLRRQRELSAGIEKLSAAVKEERAKMSPVERAMIEASEKAFAHTLVNGTDNVGTPSPLQKPLVAVDPAGDEPSIAVYTSEHVPADKMIALTGHQMDEIEDEIAAKLRSPETEKFEVKGEVRITSDTGGQKGKKPQAMGLIPPEALLALSEVYGMGAEKYDDHNYLKGYDWSLSFGALLRHVMAAEKGEWLDDESGLPHVMHAAWHCFCLFMFEKHGLGTDDRIKTVVEGLKS